MAYRESQGARQARRLSIEAEIRSLDERARELPYLAVKRAELQGELKALDALDGPASSKWGRLWQRFGPAAVAALVLVSPLIAWGSFRFFARNTVDGPAPSESAEAIAPSSAPNPESSDFAPPSTSALGVSLDFLGSTKSYAPGEVAGFVPLRNWNGARGESGALEPLADAAGAQLFGTRATWHSGVVWSTPTASTNGSIRMISGYIVQNGGPNTPGTVTVTMSNLPIGLIANGYAVIVYSDEAGNPEDQVTCMHLTAGDDQQTFCLRDATGRDYPLRESPSGYVVAVGTTDARLDTPKANCAIFKNLSANSFAVDVTTGRRTSNNTGGYLRSPVNGLQVVPMASLPFGGKAP